MTKAFIFDMDGVIIDSEPIHTRVKRDTFRHFGLEFADEDFDRYMGGTSGLIFRDVLAKSGRKDLRLEDLVEYKHAHYLEILQGGGIEPVEGARELIESLYAKGVPLGLATSSWPKVMNTVLDNFGIRQYFSSIISGGELPESKPDPAIYLLSAERLGVSPADCCVLEDTANGLLAAKRAGMRAIAFRNPNSGQQDLSLADAVVDRPADVERVLEMEV